MARCAFLLGCTLILFISGCLGDHAAERVLLLDQIRDNRWGGPHFDIDSSRIPPDWIEQHDVERIGYASHADHIRLNQEHSVKVILVPGQAVPEQPSTQPTTFDISPPMPKKVAALLDQMHAELPAFQKRWGATGTYSFYASINPSGLDTTYTGSAPINGEQTRLAYEIIAPNDSAHDSNIAVVTIIHDGDGDLNKQLRWQTLWLWRNNQWVTPDLNEIDALADRFWAQFKAQFKTVERTTRPSDTKPANGN